MNWQKLQIQLLQHPNETIQNKKTENNYMFIVQIVQIDSLSKLFKLPAAFLLLQNQPQLSSHLSGDGSVFLGSAE